MHNQYILARDRIIDNTLLLIRSLVINFCVYKFMITFHLLFNDVICDWWLHTNTMFSNQTFRVCFISRRSIKCIKILGKKVVYLGRNKGFRVHKKASFLSYHERPYLLSWESFLPLCECSSFRQIRITAGPSCG